MIVGFSGMFGQRRRAPLPDTFSATRSTSTDDVLCLPPPPPSPVARPSSSLAHSRSPTSPESTHTTKLHPPEAASQLTRRATVETTPVTGSEPLLPRLGRSTPHPCIGVQVPCVYLLTTASPLPRDPLSRRVRPAKLIWIQPGRSHSEPSACALSPISPSAAAGPCAKPTAFSGTRTCTRPAALDCSLYARLPSAQRNVRRGG